MDQLQCPGLVDRVGVGPVDPHLEGLLEDGKCREVLSDTANDVRVHLLTLTFTTMMRLIKHKAAVPMHGPCS